MIQVTQTSATSPFEFEVTISGGSSTPTHHKVTMTEAEWRRLTGGKTPPAACIEAAFHFLLDREPNEAILSRFNIMVIAKYFPDFEKKLPDYVAKL